MGDIIYGDFEWDEAKAHRNLSRHGVSFEEATTLFDDPLFVPLRTKSTPLKKIDMLLVVAYTQREQTRIIGARKVTPRERRKYDESEKEF